VNSEFVGRVGLVRVRAARAIVGQMRLVGLVRRVGAVRSSAVNFELGTSCKLAPAGVFIIQRKTKELW